VRVVSNGPTPIRDTSATDRAVESPRGPRRTRRLIAGGGLLALVAVIAVVVRWAAADRSVSAARLRIAAVERGTLLRDAAVTGRVVAAVSPTLYAPAGGTVALAIRAGDAVAKDQVLATIASPELDAELRRERSTLAELDALLGKARIGAGKAKLDAQREADEAEIAFTAATRELQAAERGWKMGAIPEVEFLRAQDAVKTARVRDANAKAAAKLAGQSAGFDLTTVEKQRERQAVVVADVERRVAELSVRAPVPGVIGTLAIADRAVVPINAPLMTVVDLSRLEVELEVPETYADDLGLGMTAEVAIGTGKATGKLSAISPEVVANNVLARVRFDGAQPEGLRQSQRVSARILIEERPGVLMLARGPWLEAHAGRAVYVVEDDLAVRRDVRVGASSVGAVEILEGLAPGDRVVIAGSETFGDAATVRIND
jgi:HlyD family secretion protein